MPLIFRFTIISSSPEIAVLSGVRSRLVRGTYCDGFACCAADCGLILALQVSWSSGSVNALQFRIWADALGMSRPWVRRPWVNRQMAAVAARDFIRGSLVLQESIADHDAPAAS